MLSFTKKQQIVILIVSLVLIMGFRSLDQNNSALEEDEEINEILTEDMEEDVNQTLNSEETAEVIVYIKGAVENPGIVSIESNKRIIDVIERAGGLSSSADIGNLNIARKVQDEEMIHVPNMGEEISTKSESSDPIDSVQNIGGQSKIDINTASMDELIGLTGVGEATAQKIIQYREEKRFSNIEEIMEVSGIGEKKFESLKDSIIVN